MKRVLIQTIGLVTCAYIVTALVNCNRSSAQSGNTSTLLQRLYPDPPNSSGSGYAHVTYASNVHQISKAEGLGGIVAESSDGRGLIFRAATSQIGSLKDGDVLVIQGVTARKVLGVDRRGDEVLLVVDSAGIGDIVQDGEIQVEAPVQFGEGHTASLAPHRFPANPLDLLVTPVYAQNSISPENNAAKAASQSGQRGATIDAFGIMAKKFGKFMIEGWTINQWSAELSGKRINLDLVMTKTAGAGGFIALIEAHGWIGSLDTMEHVTVNSGTISELRTAFKRVSGEIKLKWQIAKDSPGGYNKEDRIKLPASVTIPLAQYVGGFPLGLEIGSALIIHPAITGGKQMASGAYTVQFGGSMNGAATSKDGVSAGGDMTSSAHLDGDDGISAVAPVGMVVAFCLPRLEIGVGFKKLIPILGVAPDALTKKADEWLVFYVTTKAQSVLSPAAFQKLSKLMSQFPALDAPIANTLKSEAAIYAQLVTSVATSRTASVTIGACSRTDMTVLGQIGFGANLFGTKVDESSHSTDVFKKNWSAASGKICANLGN